MRTLAIDCATDACSVALFAGCQLLGHGHEVIHRGHAERLVPMISDLAERGRSGRILVSLGPGSFTGTRIGVAAARALGLAWEAEVLGYPTLAIIAAMASSRAPGPVSVAMTGGHGEYFVQDFGADGLPQAPANSLSPMQAAQQAAHHLVAGSKAAALVEIRGWGEAHDILPDARAALAIPHSLLTPALAPIYGRAPDAKPPSALA